MDAIKDFPDHKIKLKTKKGTAFHQKSDIFKGMMWYAYEDNFSEFIPLEIDRVKEVIALNASGKIVDDLSKYSFVEDTGPVELKFDNVVGQEDLTRFDRPKGNKKNKKRRKPNHSGNKPQNGHKKAHSNAGPTAQSKDEKPNRNKKRRPNRNKGNDKGPSQKDNS